MKFNLKSAFITLGTAGFTVLLLAGCNSGNGPSTLPHVISGIEVPQDVLNEPRIVKTPTTGDLTKQSYPRLGDVPSKPKTFSPQPVLDQAMSEMEFDRAQAKKAESDYLNPPPSMPQTDQPY